MFDQGRFDKRFNKWLKILGIAGALTACSVLLHADDTELYIANGLSTGQGRPQVLIVFDNSGSMRTEEAVASVLTILLQQQVVYQLQRKHIQLQ